MPPRIPKVYQGCSREGEAPESKAADGSGGEALRRCRLCVLIPAHHLAIWALASEGDELS